MTSATSTDMRKEPPWSIPHSTQVSQPHPVFEVHVSISFQKEGNNSQVPSPASTDQGSVSVKAILNVDTAAVFPHPPPHLTKVVLIGRLADGLSRETQKQVLKHRCKSTTVWKKSLPNNLKFKGFQIEIHCFIGETLGLNYASPHLKSRTSISPWGTS